MTNRKDDSIVILGAGLMGCAFSAAFMKASFRVILYDISEEMLASAPERIRLELQAQGINQTEDLFTHFECTDTIDDLNNVNCFLETITEKIQVKQKLYQQLEPLLNEQTLFLSNTSTIMISELAEFVPHRERFCGFHFFHPVRERSLLEIIRGSKTSSATIDQAVELAKKIDKTPLVVGDGPAFLVNRLLHPYLSKALKLLLEGASIDQIDDAAQDYGMAMGPIRIMDEIGLDVTMHGGWTLLKAFPERTARSPILLEMVRLGHLGRKTGTGFRKFTSKTLWDAKGENYPELEMLIAASQQEQNIMPQSFTNKEITDLLIGGMREEGRRVLEENIVPCKEIVNQAVILGLGYPKNGPPLLE